MKTLKNEERHICERQGELFATSTETETGGSAVFIRRFMRSALAERIDIGSLYLETYSTRLLLGELKEEYKGKAYGSEVYSAAEMYWMGYLYRYWCLAQGISSKAVYKIIGARELRKLYYPYHSLAVDAAIERILESKGLTDETPVERGVRLLKEIQSSPADA